MVIKKVFTSYRFNWFMYENTQACMTHVYSLKYAPDKNGEKREYVSFCYTPTSNHLLLKIYYPLSCVPPDLLELFTVVFIRITLPTQRIRTDTRLLFQLMRSIAAGWILHRLILTTAGKQSLAAEASTWLCYRSFLPEIFTGNAAKWLKRNRECSKLL